MLLLPLLLTGCLRSRAPAPTPTPTPAPLQVSEDLPVLPLVPGTPQPGLSDDCPTPQAHLTRLQGLLSGPSGDITEGVMVCSVRLSEDPPKGRRWDAFGNAPDPMVMLELGDRPLAGACAKDTLRAVLSWPSVALTAGDKFKATVYDLDVRNHDLAGTDIDLYTGDLPISVSDDHFAMRCSILPAEAAEQLAAARIAPALRAVVALRDAPLSPMSADWGHPTDQLDALHYHIEGIAGLKGWADPRAGGLLQLQDEAIASWSERAQAAVAALAASTPPSGSSGPYTVSVTEVTCDRRCTVTVAYSIDRDTPTAVNPDDLKPVAVLPTAKDHRLQRERPDAAPRDPSTYGQPSDPDTIKLSQTPIALTYTMSHDTLSLVRISLPGAEPLLLGLP